MVGFQALAEGLYIAQSVFVIYSFLSKLFFKTISVVLAIIISLVSCCFKTSQETVCSVFHFQYSGYLNNVYRDCPVMYTFMIFFCTGGKLVIRFELIPSLSQK